jgi:hypothetical protein
VLHELYDIANICDNKFLKKISDLIESNENNFTYNEQFIYLETNSCYENKITPLTLSIILRRLDILYSLLKYGADPNMGCVYRGKQFSPLQLVSRYVGHAAFTEALLQYGSNLIMDDGNNINSYTQTTRYTNHFSIMDSGIIFDLYMANLRISPRYKFNKYYRDNHKLYLQWLLNFDTYITYIPTSIRTEILRYLLCC